MSRASRLLLSVLGVAGSVAFAQDARADTLESCGDFFFDPVGDVECTVEVEGGCTAACEPIAFEVECAADLQIGCQGGCDIDIEVGCDVDCEASCNLECDPGSFDCSAYCSAGCEADCDAQCSGSANGSECSASCRANCSAECGASCEASPPDCEGSCQASCQGQCKAEASASCQIECQADGYLECKSDLQGGCEIACEEPSGALFCDGQWVNTADLESCADEIIAYFDVEISGYAEAECTGNTCSAEAGCTTECAAAPGHHDTNIGFMAVGLVGLGAAAVRRARRKR